MERIHELIGLLCDSDQVLKILELEMPEARQRMLDWLHTVFALSVELEVEASKCQRSTLAGPSAASASTAAVEL